MHFLFVTYRWGSDLLGGAELHHRRLAQELVDAGHQVSVVTSTCHDMSTFWHWGVMWEDRTPEAFPPDEFNVTRLPRRHYSKWRMAIGAKLLQHAMEQEESGVPVSVKQDLTRGITGHSVHLLNGWHYPEIHNGKTNRWTHKTSWMHVSTDDGIRPTLTLIGFANGGNYLRLYHEDTLLGEKRCEGGMFEFSAPLPKGFNGMVRLETYRVDRLRRDHRSLGVSIEEITLYGDQKEARADLSSDYRSLGRSHPETWKAHLLDRAAQRPELFNCLIDRLRGPMITGLQRALEESAADHVIHCNMPWGNLTNVRPGDLTMPLWHVEDEFYYWQHWINALRRSRFVLANTPYTEKEFYPPLGIKAKFVGPPIWQPEVDISEEEKLAFRHRFHLDAADFVVLTVCRKSGEKRYDAVAAAVEELVKEGRRVRMIGVGPDVDRMPFNWEGCQWVGKLLDHDLQAAYATCDVLAFMSESESFGMVIPEAWHHGKPVVVNRLCGPSASLVAEGLDGLLAAPGKELTAALRSLCDQPLRGKALGREGRARAQKDFVRGAAARRLLDALEAEKAHTAAGDPAAEHDS